MFISCINLLLKVPNSAVKDCNNFTEFAGKEFLDPATDETVKAASKAWENGPGEQMAKA